MRISGTFFLLLSFVFAIELNAQTIPSESIVPNDELSKYLQKEVQNELGGIRNISEAELAEYFRKKFEKRYFFDWKNFDARFEKYASLYPASEEHHADRALDHMTKYPAATVWKLPFNYSTGEAVDAYAMRHLARQHKMVDIAFYYNYREKDTSYLNYFTSQLESLNKALENDAYETIEDGNGVYEAFRSGYRVLNWLQIHNMFLGEEAYSNEDQLKTIATLLQHGQHLYEDNPTFHPGNHQTRGMSALAMLSILFRDFEGTEKWYDRSMDLLQQHLSAEINDDGFQFERTIHYHMSDIKNYFYVYQLAQNSGYEVSPVWKESLKSLFTTLAKIAYPDGSAPVLSDDTDTPWAEKNDISGAMTLGYLLFNDPEMGFFATNKVEPSMYWYLSNDQLKRLNDIEIQKPDYGSFSFPKTGYYVMREGWNENDMMMVISAGLDDEKPDHQHGDMLGIQAMANGRVLLPNYQVRYFLKDLEFFKNSMVKNVALVDDELQGKDYRPNKGGSGFGKFGKLPNPTTVAFKTEDDHDLYIGSHDGFENTGVEYSRQVLFIKDDFWVVKDNFKARDPHTYKQVWQGHYTFENGPDLLRATFEDGSGLDIFQLRATDTVMTSGTRGKEWAVVSSKAETDHSFITILFPFDTFDARVNEDEQNPELKGWKINEGSWKMEGKDAISLSREEQGYFFSVRKISFDAISIDFSEPSDVFLKKENGRIYLQSLSEEVIDLVIQNSERAAGEERELSVKPGEETVLDGM
jgi:hypothetical protein